MRKKSVIVGADGRFNYFFYPRLVEFLGSAYGS